MDNGIIPSSAVQADESFPVPGPFVVLQGMPGDGMSNTIDSMPLVHFHGGQHEDEMRTGSENISSSLRSLSRGDGDLNLVVDSANFHDDSSNISLEDIIDSGYHHVPPSRETEVSSSSDSVCSNNSGIMIVQEEEHEGGEGNQPHIQNTTNVARGILSGGSRSLSTARRRVDVESNPFSDPSSNNILSHEETAHLSSSSNTFRRVCRNWRRECREKELRQMSEIIQQQHSSRNNTTDIQLRDQCWWQRDGKLAVFASPSIHHHISSSERVAFSGSYSSDNEEEAEDLLVLGLLSPGTTVLGCELVPALPFVPSTQQQQPQPGTTHSEYTFLKISSPLSGFVLYKCRSFVHLAPGLPSRFCDPKEWIWRVTCREGAYVRSGLELNSNHLTTIPYGTLINISQKTVNAMGLCRLRCSLDSSRSDTFGTTISTSTAWTENSEPGTASNNDDTDTGTRNRNTNARVEVTARAVMETHAVPSPHHRPPLLLQGWISEALNPLSGQRGPIAQPLPFPVPALYRVTLPDGAIIRSDIELSSSEIRVAPPGSIIKVVGRAFSEHPMDQCIERLRLAGGGGWVSVKLNRPPPLDILILELIGLDESFNPEDPGVWHLRAQQEHEDAMRFHGGSNLGLSVLPAENIDIPNASAIASGVDVRASGAASNHQNQPPRSTNVDSATNRSLANGCRSGDSLDHNIKSKVCANTNPEGRKKHYFSSKSDLSEEKCLICLTEERTATIVHGGTGHIACCLACSRVLKARGDRCPVCRLPIDLVIQQFWA
mmetsp:Transcript_9152/g.13281  ORF Transcript_9152/g.13281 Transcript_9152/m.13281 type:complete len:773 (-) Transcript_9152:263-2581(-)|eukprot:CAMPEP_0195530868 /NCGR_PEP_ID=MMETSP0794_2-20130614/33968_1 /TAXON_ID=515487 /ORGANISM="Stephanopyxis turris, Strain CCMP 815" /LENGTH=772 /DNA_ID=CAMNT_0040662479 /DNA_START=889 /DNA_END=3207 /DNA_ORIENTATION=+